MHYCCGFCCYCWMYKRLAIARQRGYYPPSNHTGYKALDAFFLQFDCACVRMNMLHWTLLSLGCKQPAVKTKQTNKKTSEEGNKTRLDWNSMLLMIIKVFYCCLQTILGQNVQLEKKREFGCSNRIAAFPCKGLTILVNHRQTSTRIHYLFRQKSLFLMIKLSELGLY